ncbi:electron transfer DM13 domain-containing protein [Ditylenchus destructor]|uniref:Electron transfer DM13 domain-containing protein n=1 Tax=Ditylenchus destructor TaxID=166010 RepID=A0AAD4NC47_9BILA|nr:electron transfer DM13 domain-containing protein [Ditylenchus destructor]
MRGVICATALIAVCCSAELVVNSYDPEYGIFLGQFSSADSNEQPTGFVYAINESAIQIIDFAWSGKTSDTFFWLDPSDRPSRDGVRLATFEYGRSPIGKYSVDTHRVILVIPHDQKITSFRSLSLFSLQGDVNYGSVQINENLVLPRPQMLPDELKGDRFKIFGLIQILDMRTIRVIGFSFEGNKAPDGYFFVGQGSNITKESGVKAAIRGRDSFDLILPMNERYTGGKDIYVELPDGYDIQHIDFFSIYSVKYDISYASVSLRNISRYSIPPYVPLQKGFEISDSGSRDWTWNLSNLLGTTAQKNFTFQLGPPGGKRGYQGLHRIARPPRYVWYVNGYMANLYLKRGVTYNFIVEGGMNTSSPEFNNPLYLTNDSYGGYAKLSKSEQAQAKIYAPEFPIMAAGRLCRWLETKHSSSSSSSFEENSDEFESFTDFRATLKLSCEEDGSPFVFEFTPTNETPSTFYFQSYNNYQMGSKIFVVDEFPVDLKHIVEEPYQYDARQHQTNLELTPLLDLRTTFRPRTQLFNQVP